MMKNNAKRGNGERRTLSKTQEVLYQKEFKHADRVYKNTKR